ncbi:MAG: thioredoxin domain-containing protein [Desulfatiglandaceae bacterium]
MDSPSTTGGTPNHLIHEKSPYLLQHAYNPVDWYPWGEEAFQKARREDKPILVSIGYSTCHWCHVMERESFSNPEIAAVMNRYLVSMKVDREERPDIDQVYITAVSAMTGSAGWPLNVFLTPGGKPFFGGTYFPPDSRGGQPGFSQLVERIGKAWQDPETREKILANAKQVTGALSAYVSGAEGVSELKAEWLYNGFKSFQSSFDQKYGGFGGAPKFPKPLSISFLFRYYARFRNQAGRKADGERALEMALSTLRSMAKGGIYDQMGGGFHRYSTDDRWHIPHFEKMLYDNGLLVLNYLDAFQITRDHFFSNVARETLEYVLREMTSPEGGFFSAQDADSLPQELAEKVSDTGHGEKKEGAYYVWGADEIKGILGARDNEIFAYYCGIKPGGNAESDPFGELKGKNTLFIAHSLKEVAGKFGIPESEVQRIVTEGKAKLFKARCGRPLPHLDDKVITSWNGLMISAFARAHQVLGTEEYLDAATRAASFVKKNLYDAGRGALYRRWRNGERGIRGVADDYAFLAQGLLDLYEASFDPQWLKWAVRLSEEAMKRFYDEEKGGFFLTEAGQDPLVPLRMKMGEDNVIPVAGTVMAMNLLRLLQLKDRNDFRSAAEKTLKSFGTYMDKIPESVSGMLSTLDFALGKPLQVVIAGPRHAPLTQAMLKVVHSRFIPDKIVVVTGNANIHRRLVELAPFLKPMKQIEGKPTAYVCIGHACRLPTNSREELAGLLDKEN